MKTPNRLITFVRRIYSMLKSKPEDNYKKEIYKSIYNKDILKKKPFYNIGAGAFYHPYWTNIDYNSQWYNKIQKDFIHYDLTKNEALPINDNSALIIYTSHTIEHVKEDSVLNLFKEANRVLCKGGIIRITCPDAEADYRALINNDLLWFYWDQMYSKEGTFEHIFYKPAISVPIEERWLHHVASQLAPNDKTTSKLKFDTKKIREIISELEFEDALNFFTNKCIFNPDRPGNHVSWWSDKKVKEFLMKAEFEKVFSSGYGQSSLPVLRNTKLFDSTHPQMSLYVEAVKS